MNMHAEPLPHAKPAEGGTIARLINLFNAGSDDEDVPLPSGDEITLDKLRRFILTNDLGLTPVTLASALGIVTGEDLRLIRKVREREDQGRKITRIWLESQAAPKQRADGARKLERVIKHLEHGVESLSTAAITARDATTSYNHVLAENERQLTLTETPDVGQVVDLVREMIVHTDALEKRLNATEQESRAMREDLKKARQLADEDHLTGLPNRRAFEQRLNEARASRKPGEPISVGFCDIDNFKAFNDRFGHDTGDRVLKLVAQHLSRATGDDCFVARHGGEEFAVLFENMSLDDARAKLDEAREDLQSRRLKDRRTGKTLGELTFSAGLALCEEKSEQGAALKSADQALYSAKQQGRNRVVICGG